MRAISLSSIPPNRQEPSETLKLKTRVKERLENLTAEMAKLAAIEKQVLASGRFGKQDFAYLPNEDVYRCLAGEKLKYYYTNEEDG